MYADGEGVLRDDSQALTWFLRAAEQGLAPAQFAVGTMYGAGRGVTQDYDEAFLWYYRAARQGEPQAQVGLGALFADGLGTPPDPVRGFLWMTIGRAGLDGEAAAEADSMRGDLAGQMTQEQLDEAANLARACLESGYVECG